MMIQSEKNKVLHVLIHLIGWGIMFGFPWFFAMKTSQIMTWSWYLGYVFVPMGFMVVFYVNYFFLIDRVLFCRNLVKFILLNFVLIAVVWLGLEAWRDFYFAHFMTEKPVPHPMPPKLMLISRDFMLMGLTVALSVAIRMTGNLYLVENEKKELEKARTEAELQNLKSQLNPHFLFNTLNNIYALIAIDSDRAQYAIHDLSKLLRHVLYDNNQHWVPLDHELTFMKSYIELMSLRLSDKVRLDIHIPDSGNNILVAPLLFITLIENAFKHGISPSGKSFIEVHFEIDDKVVSCVIENSYFPKKDNDRSGSGIGLENLSKRLELLYPGQYRLHTGRVEDRFVAELKLMKCERV